MRYGVTYYKLEARYLDHERICISTNVAVDIHFYGLTILHGRRTSITPLALGVRTDQASEFAIGFN